ncbi:hypothetical protein A5789_09200 [Nocardia sp. 852002-51101_SCH5132738]|uniref:hypothetical protein n=1 Tax=Nocardia sp. 852002-51101_SCH5132738 TaxID=1834095 RepID=UPI0007EC2754|nr:hypothetical protein [Nocardia sp. 852002-51101_SCH5132738]OBA44457.1 hypothetical protein A5789_09200 [Nocardia sp. 852002-51101_SCH5132738]
MTTTAVNGAQKATQSPFRAGERVVFHGLFGSMLLATVQPPGYSLNGNIPIVLDVDEDSRTVAVPPIQLTPETAPEPTDLLELLAAEETQDISQAQANTETEREDNQ